MSTTDSKWHVLQRCLAILQRLQQGSVDRVGLMQAVRELVIDPYGEGTADAQRKRFERDIENLRDQLLVKIDCPPPDYKYCLVDPGPLAGIGLSSESLYGLAFLLNTFSSDNGANDIVQPLLDGILRILPTHQQRELAKFNSTLELSLQRLDTGNIAPLVWDKVRTAVQKHQLLRFKYIARRHEERLPRTHTVEPYVFRFFRGHYELKAYCRHWVNPYGQERSNVGWFRYRLDHFQADGIEILPDKLPVGQREQRLISIRYSLSPSLARGGISRYFEDMHIGKADSNGWVEVSGRTDDLFEAERIFLAYGEHCVVLSPSELVRKMKKSVEAMAKSYEILPIT